jgi:four helix bundle protein
MNPDELKQRTKQFGLRIIKLVDCLPHQRSADIIGKQLLRSGTSVGANYRSACRGRTKPEFIAKAGIAIEEADESLYWMEMLIDAQLIPETLLKDLMNEANEIISILTASVKTARNHLNSHPN